MYWATFLVLGVLGAAYLVATMARLESVHVKVGDLQPIGWTLLGGFLGALLVHGWWMVGDNNHGRRRGADRASSRMDAPARASPAPDATSSMTLNDWMRAVAVHRSLVPAATPHAVAQVPPTPHAAYGMLPMATPSMTPAQRMPMSQTVGSQRLQRRLEPTAAAVTPSAGAGAGAGAGAVAGAGAGAGAGASAGVGAAAVASPPGSVQSPLDAALKQFDDKSIAGDYDGALAAVRAVSSDGAGNVEWEYRIAKGLYNVANKLDAKSDEHKELMTEAEQHAEAAVAADERSVKAHQWYGPQRGKPHGLHDAWSHCTSCAVVRLAIILSAVGDFSSTKIRLRNAHRYKEHTLRALKLDPKDATLHHMMGRFCYEVAGT